MDATFTQRLLKGLASSALGQVIGGLNAILLVPLFLLAWGADGYGRWLSLTAMISYLSLLDLGGQSYIGNLLAVEYVKRDVASFRKILSAGLSLFVLLNLGVLLIVVLLAMIPQLPFPGLNRSMNLDERLVILFMSATLLISIPGGVYVTAYRATGLFARGTMVGNILRSVGLGLSAGLLYIHASPGIYAAGIFGHGILMTMAVIWDTQRQITQCRGVRISFTYAKEGMSYLGGSLYFWIMALAGAINQQGVLLLLTAVSPVAVALFATHRTVAGLLRYISTLLQGPLWPEFSFLWAGKLYPKIERLVVTSTALSMLGSGVVAVLLYLFIPYIYPVWTGKKLDLHIPLLSVLLLQGVLAAGWYTVSWGLMASNQHRQLAVWMLLNALVTIILAALLVGRWGALGAAFASLIGDVSCGLLVIPWLTGRLLQISAKRIYSTMFLALFVLAVIAGAGTSLSPLLPKWLALSVFCLLTFGMIYPALIFILGAKETNDLVGQFLQSIRGLVTTALRNERIKSLGEIVII
jgi:O-antigen/teichoic acid export membrane protein